MTLSAAGVASLLEANAVLFGIVKYAGAGYLTWLAFGMLRAAWAMWRSRKERAAAMEAAPAEEAAEERPYRRAFVVSLFNPKAILFFVAFFVQFVSESNPVVGFLTLGVLAQLASVLYLSALIFGGSRLAAAFRRRRMLSAGATSAAGVLFLGFAVKLSLASV